MITSSATTFAPHQSSPLSRTTSPFKNPRPPPTTPVKTAKLWDEYERRAIEKARKRDRIAQTAHPQRCSASDICAGRTSNDGSTMRSSFDFKFKRAHVATPSTTVSTCKSCQQPITYASGICERCTRTIILPSPTGEATPPPSPSILNPASTNHRPREDLPIEEAIMPKPCSPKRRSFCPLPTQLVDPPIRLSSLRPPPTQEATLEPARSRKTSLTDPNEPFLRLQITHQAYTPHSHSNSDPVSPTYMPTTPPSTSHSRTSTRPSSLANIASLPTSAHPNARNDSATPSEFSAQYPYAYTIATSPPSLCRVSYALQNTTSAWDDWDSDEDAERVGLVGWMGRRKVKSRGSGKEGKSSMDSFESEQEGPERSTKDESEGEDEEGQKEHGRRPSREGKNGDSGECEGKSHCW